MNFPSFRISLIIILTLAGYPLVAGLSEFMSLPNREISIGMRSVIICAVIFHLLLNIQQHQKLVRVPIFFILFMLFWSLYFARLLIDSIFNTEALKQPIMDYILFGFGTCFLPAASMFWIKAKDFNSNSVQNSFAVISSIAVVLFFLNIFNTETIISFYDFTSIRGSSEYLNPISIGHLGASLAIVCTWKFFENIKIDNTHKLKILLIIGVIIGISGIIIGASRGPILTTLLAFIFFAASNFDQIAKTRRIILIGSLIFVIFNLIEGEDILVLNRIIESSFSDEARESLFADGIRLVLQHPFIGAGIEPLDSYPHNLLLESFMVFGMISGVIFFLILYYGTVSAWQLIRKRTTHGWIALLYVQYVAGAMVSGSLYGSNIFWVIVTLTVITNENLRKKIYNKSIAIN